MLAVLLAGGILHGPAIISGRVLLPADIVLLMRPWAPAARERFPDFRFAQNQLLGPMFEYYSWRHYARSRIRSGEIPLWNPYEMGGNVLLANSQSAVLYPPNVLLYVLPLWIGINLTTLFHTWVTGLLMLGFLRAIGLRHVAATAGAVTWMLCGCLIVWTEFQTPAAALCWLPGALWAGEKALRGKRQEARGKGQGDGAERQQLRAESQELRAESGELRAEGRARSALYVAACAGCLALSLVAGHPQFAFYVVLTTFLYFVVRGGVRGLARGIAVIALAGALAAATLLPVGEASRINHRRKDVGYAEAVKLRLPPIHLTSLLLPNIRGNPRDYVRVENGEARPGNPYIGPYDFTEYCLYVGIPGLILAALGVAWRWRDRSAIAVCVAGTVGLALALGTPVGALFFYLVPGYAQFHAPARAVCMVHFALAALAAFGLDTVLRGAERQEARGERQEARGERQEPRAESQGLRAAGRGRLAAVVCAGTALLCVAAWPLTGLQLPVVMSADWMAYAAGSIRHGVLFAAATGVCIWMLLREPTGKRREARSEGREAAEWAWMRRVAPIGLAALCAGDLLLWSLGYNPATDPRMLELPPESASVPSTRPWERAISFETPETGLKSLIVPNYNVVVGYREAQGADSVHSRRYHLAMQAVAERLSERRPAFPDGNTVRMPLGHHPLFDLLNVTRATTLPSSGPPAAHYVPQSDGELRVWRNTSAIGPGRVVTEVGQVRDVLEAVSALGAQSQDARRTAMVEGPTPTIAAKGTSATASVGVRSFTPHRVVYDVVTATQGLLVVSEVAYPGWKARVEGREARGERQYARMYVADGVFRAVVVPPGASRVTFLYVPSSFRLGLFLSLISCGALAALAGAFGALKMGGGGKMRASVPSGI